MVARVTGEDTQLAEAEGLAKAVLSLPAVFPWYANMARAALGLVAVQRRDIAAAQEQYAALESLSSVIVHYTSSGRLLGLLAQTVGQLDRSVNHFEDALGLCKQAGYRPELAWTCHDCVDTLLERNGPGDPEWATSLMEEGLGITHELGMGHLTQRLMGLRQRAELASAHRREFPDGLTEREVEVLRLVSMGRSNSEISEELALSIRTVERHITNFYGKIHARGRAEATAYAFSHGLAG